VNSISHAGPLLRINSQNSPYNIGTMCNKPQLIISERFLSMEVCILRKFEYYPRLVVIMEFYAKLRVHMPEPFDSAVLTSRNYSSRLGEFRLPSSHVRRVV